MAVNIEDLEEKAIKMLNNTTPESFEAWLQKHRKMKTEGFGLLDELVKRIEDIEGKSLKREEVITEALEHIEKRIKLYSNFNSVSMFANDQQDQMANNVALIELHSIMKILRKLTENS